MGKKLSNVITKYQDIGNCEIDVDLVCKLWNHTWGIYQWKDEYRLIKFLRLGTESTQLKVRIPIEQAKEIIKRLKLDGEKGMFASATTWRQSEIFWEKHREFMEKKNKRLNNQ